MLYKQLKNLIHNDLAISKQDIEIIIRKEIAHQVKRYFESPYLQSIINRAISNHLRLSSGIKNEVAEHIKRNIAEQLIIDIKPVKKVGE